MKVYEVIGEITWLGFGTKPSIQIVDHFLHYFEWENDDEITPKQAEEIIQFAIKLSKLLPLSMLKKGIPVHFFEREE